MILHNFIIIIIIGVIITAQIYVYRNTKRKIALFKDIFPQYNIAYSIIQKSFPIEENNETDNELEEVEYMVKTIEVSQVKINSNNATLKEITKSLNMYLQKNEGAASDFNLMKDVVERYCDAEENEINIQQPVPLYLGLMGTMIGIIIGIGFIAFNGGLASGALMKNIGSLMTCVAIAMIASFVGIVCTTHLSWMAKNASSIVEASKNKFYSWLQTKLLPVLSGNAVNAIHLLQANLLDFNKEFENNVKGFNAALAKINQSANNQIELISLINQIDVKKVAQANVVVLKELQKCTDEIGNFNEYLHNVTDYLSEVNQLNNNINEHLTRTQAIERMGIFFEEEINQIKTRERYINEVVANIDNTLQKTFEELTEATKENVNNLKNDSVEGFDILVKTMREQREDFNKELQTQREEYLERSEEFMQLLKEVQNLGAVKTAMNAMIDVIKEQNRKFDKLIQSFENMSLPQSHEKYVQQNIKFPISIKIMLFIITLLTILFIGLNAYEFVITHFLNNGE